MEAIHSRTGRSDERLYSLRITNKVRAVVRRACEYIDFLTLHAVAQQASR